MENIEENSESLKYQLLAFLVHDIIKHFIFTYFFKEQHLKYQLVVFLVHDVIKQFIFAYLDLGNIEENCEMRWKINKKSKLNSEKVWKK
jgi:biotin transporter BioY